MAKPPNQINLFLFSLPCRQPFYHINVDEDDDNIKQLKQAKSNYKCCYRKIIFIIVFVVLLAL
jgi:hypothetical protein